MNTLGWFLTGTVVGAVFATIIYALLVAASCGDDE